MESVELNYKPALQEIRQQFAEKLDTFLCELIKKRDFIDFSFEYHYLGNLENNFTDNLARILRQLPQLPIEENYSFFSKTSLIVTVQGKDEHGNHNIKVTMSDNIKEKLQKQNKGLLRIFSQEIVFNTQFQSNNFHTQIV